MRWLANSFVVPAAALVLAIAGCGTDLPTVAPVQGRIYIDGRPVPLGRIDFVPQSGPAATARIQPDGSYRLTTFDKGDGAVVGPHVVTIRAVEMPDDSETTDLMVLRKSSRASTVEPQIRWHAPERYSRRNTTPLTAEVRNGDNTFDFQLSAN